MPLNMQYLENEIIDQFLYDESPRPWIIGFSGGKDSTMLLQVVWNALKKIDPYLLNTRRIYVVCNDTLVENPRIVKFINKTLIKIGKAAVKDGIPITVHQTIPELENSFWVKLIGLGYPAPNKFYRWCLKD